MRSPFVPIAWGAVILVTALRATFAYRLPLTGDEAYYWEWSRRLAAGYIDHPPAVAFTIAAFSWIGRSPFAVRIAFVLCGLGAAFATGGAARTLARDERAGAIAALAVSLAPIMSVAFGIATPDGPYSLAWAAAMYFAALAVRDGKFRWLLLLGIAFGVALLSRFFAFALVVGIAIAAFTPQYRDLWKRGLWVSFLVALVMYAPFIFWNAQHHWSSFAFALLQRHPSDEIAFTRPPALYALSLLAFSPGLWIAITIAAARPKDPLVAWTALPLSVLLLIVSLHERVEVYWFIGPFISLCIALGVARVQSAWVWAPAAVLSALVFVAAIAPFTVYGALTRAGLHLSDSGPFEMFTYPHLAKDVRGILKQPGAVAMTDGYGFSSLLDFYGDLSPVVIGYDAQGAEARKWFTDRDRPVRALFIDKVPLATRADFSAQLARACGRVIPGPTLAYKYRRYFTTWCYGMSPNAVATLRWQTPKS